MEEEKGARTDFFTNKGTKIENIPNVRCDARTPHTIVSNVELVFDKKRKHYAFSSRERCFFALVATKTIVFTTHTIRPLATSFNARPVRRHLLEPPINS